MIVINDLVYFFTSTKMTSKKTKKKSRRDVVERDVARVKNFLSSSSRLFKIVVQRRKTRRSNRQHVDYSRALSCRHDDEKRDSVC